MDKKKKTFTEADLKAKGFVLDEYGRFVPKGHKLIMDGALSIPEINGKTYSESNLSVKLPNMVFVPYQVPSKKNGQNIGRHPKTGKPILYKNKQYLAYKTASAMTWKALRADFHKLLAGKEKPYKIHFKFIRADKRRFDYLGPGETVQDFMTDFGWIEDDDARTMKPIYEDFEVDKNNPGVYIWVS